MSNKVCKYCGWDTIVYLSNYHIETTQLPDGTKQRNWVQGNPPSKLGCAHCGRFVDDT
jgi:hypothetical protein